MNVPASPETPLFEVVDLHVSSDEGVEILHGVDLTVRPGEVHALMGPNGSGKSTLASVLLGSPEYVVTQGSIRFRGDDITDWSPDVRGKAGLFLAFEGRDPRTGEQLLDPHRARRINAIMMLCGHYDNSGEFAFRVGLPGKSGVGGGILCIAPGQGSIAVWSPGLNEAGTSLVGALALEHFAYAAGWSVFD